MPTARVIISHYNAWPVDQLVALLDQVRAIPAGHPFDCRIVVNQAVPRPLELPSRHSGVEVMYRENTGFNIGAWELGWRADPAADYYLFLQEECQILRPDWLGAFIRAASRPEVGLVGESLVWHKLGWDRIKCRMQDVSYEGDDSMPDLSLVEGITRFLAAKGIPIAETGEHLQSLILCARRDVLEAIGGFPIGLAKGEAISCEVAISRLAAMKEFQIKQVGFLPFRYILHPQWSRIGGRASSLALDWVYRYTPMPLLERSRKAAYRLQKSLTASSRQAR